MATGSNRHFLLRLGFNASGALMLASGCASIIGVSDLEGEDEPGSSGGALIGGMGGKGGKGGSGGKGGTSGGSDGEGGEAGTPSTGGASGGEGGAPVVGASDCNGDPLELNEELVRGCIMYESCYLPTVSISTCVTYNVPDAFAGRSCAQTAATCQDIADCRHRAFIYPDGPVTCDAGDLGRCEGNVAVNCDNAVDPHFADCDLEGGTCELQSDGWADCKVVDACVEADNEYGCSGDFWYYCFEGVGYGTDCTTVAASCEDGGVGAYDCYYAVTSCNTPSATCSGDTVVSCDGETRTDYDCGGANLACETSGSNQYYCLAGGCEAADWIGCTESCDGSALTFCMGGAQVTVDCQDYGFDTCKEDVLTFSDNTTQDIAVCAFDL